MTIIKCSAFALVFLVLAGCANSPIIDKTKVFSQLELTNEQISSDIVGHRFAAQVRTGRHRGWYEVSINTNGRLVIDNGRFTRRWSISNGQLCITPCFKFYQNPEKEDQYFAVIDDETDVLLNRR